MANVVLGKSQVNEIVHGEVSIIAVSDEAYADEEDATAFRNVGRPMAYGRNYADGVMGLPDFAFVFVETDGLTEVLRTV